MTKKLLLLPALLFMQQIAQAQITNVLVDNSASDGECTIIINGSDPSQVLAATNPDVIYRSSDGGLTWTEANVSPFSTVSLIGDVALATDNAGRYYFQSLDASYLFRQLRSSDNGVTWNTETAFGDAGWVEDKNWLTCDRVPGSPYNGRIYCAWTRRSNGPSDPGYIFLNHSADAGQTWVPRDTLDIVQVSPAVPPIGTGLAVGPAGEISVTWGGGSPNRIYHKRSTDGGSTWPASPVIVDVNVQPANDYYDYIQHPISFSAQFTSLACDASGGPNNGNLYCVWDDVRNGPNNADIFLARSTDGGQTWATQRINDDTTTRNQVVPTVAVDPGSGWVFVSYLDARLNTDSFDDTLHYYLAWSTDGGQTFHNIQVSQQASTIQNIHSDYMGMDALGGKVCLLWVGGVQWQKTWSSCIPQTVLLPLAVAQQEAQPALVLYPAVPNPATDFTAFDFQVSEETAVTLTISDLQGKTLIKPVNGTRYLPGRHQVKLFHSEVDLPAGIYIATVTTLYGQQSRKFIVSK
ncbi:MAG: BNR/Asp-box repeat-containing protein [Bacteroidetes bacterium]|nr:MAG: BNR/Asp-box repeat-containing protein [Bacteroidota bacterium]